MFSFPTSHCLTMSLFYRTRCMLGIPMGATTGVSCHQVKYETNSVTFCQVPLCSSCQAVGTREL